jgi:hypothetical protein
LEVRRVKEEDARGNCITTSFIKCALSNIINHQIKEDEMGREHSINGSGKKFI